MPEMNTEFTLTALGSGSMGFGGGNVRRAGTPQNPGPANPVLCQFTGTFDFEPWYAVDAIKVLVVKTANAANPYASPQAEAIACKQSGVALDSTDVFDLFTNAGNWDCRQKIAANIDNDPNGTLNWVSVFFQVSSLAASFDPPPDSECVIGASLNAVPVDSCGGGAFGPLKALRASRAGMSERMLPVLEESQGWLKYSFFSLAGGSGRLPGVYGFQLASPGCSDTPLSARRIAIAAENVAWFPRSGRGLVITKPLGNFDCGSFDGAKSRLMQVPGLPKYSLFVHQRNFPPTDLVLAPVHSECREHPQQILLNPEEPIYVQVNNVAADRTKSDGTLDFWVKVLM